MDNDDIISDSTLTEIMHKAGVRPSLQRLEVLDYVANRRCHPTADDIFATLSKKYLSLSRTTVYNSLNVLAEVGILRALDIESGNKHYDFAYQPTHGHFLCKKCGKIFDTLMPETLASSQMPGFEIDCIDLFYKGICPECKAAEANSD